MIVLSHEKSSAELKPLIDKLGVPCEVYPLPYGDAAFQGNGPDGIIQVGIERKRLHDMLKCIDDSRYTGHQRVGMSQRYKASFLILEGLWRPHSESGLLMEGFFDKEGRLRWAYCRPGGQNVMCYKLSRYLMSVSLANVNITCTWDMAHTAYAVVDAYWYFQKRWSDHTSMRQMHSLVIPTLNTQPSLVRKWAFNIEGVGTDKSAHADNIFRTPVQLANASESDWLKISGMGVKTAQSIVRQINGWGRR